MEYDDMIHLPHHQSKKRMRMSLSDRAAQFAPFAALTGHEQAVEETARLTEERLELSDSAREELDRMLQFLAEHPKTVRVTYFIPDAKKAGGAYVTVTGMVKKISRYHGVLTLTDGTEILVKDIWECVPIQET
ncbi:MAG: YolD-like family protein [Ruminococcaceae bacterium]|nr:YolD-like family protein [Oscillospiraceae bacterium]